MTINKYAYASLFAGMMVFINFFLFLMGLRIFSFTVILLGILFELILNPINYKDEKMPKL